MARDGSGTFDQRAGLRLLPVEGLQLFELLGGLLAQLAAQSLAAAGALVRQVFGLALSAALPVASPAGSFSNS